MVTKCFFTSIIQLLHRQSTTTDPLSLCDSSDSSLRGAGTRLLAQRALNTSWHQKKIRRIFSSGRKWFSAERFILRGPSLSLI